jgi:F0F1-type ATP synthase epsilon subunit
LAAQKTFNCVVIAPSGKLVDCQTTSVVFPAHDGQVGVWYNHMPMLCNLGLGIMEVKRLRDDQQTEEVFILVDGGFSMVCANQLKVVSYDVILPAELKPEGIEHIRANLTKEMSSGALDQQQRQHRARKLALLTHVLELTSAASGGGHSS